MTMRYHALACDFDGTLAWNGYVDPQTIEALTALHQSGRRLLLVTGRELDDLLPLVPSISLFDRVVAENGGVLYDPETQDERLLTTPPPASFVEDLRARGVQPLSVGKAIVATWHPHEMTVLDTINQHGLEHHVIFNKGAVMVLPPGVNKASGLLTALYELHLSPRNTVCIGDAENDQTMFHACELAVAVNNALAPVKANADLVTAGHHGQGVAELIQKLLATDLSDDVLCQRRSLHFWRRCRSDARQHLSLAIARPDRGCSLEWKIAPGSLRDRATGRLWVSGLCHRPRG